jgi:hypothetical protein
MTRISISAAAFDAIAATLPVGSVGYEAETNAKGERWLKRPTPGNTRPRRS